MDDNTGKALEAIFDLEIARLSTAAKTAPLELEDVKKLESLTRAWRTYNATKSEPKQDDGTLDAMSDADLIAAAKSG